MMDEEAKWWSLHLRVARGESLSAEEMSRYETSLRQFDENERLGPLQGAKQAHENLQRLEAERSRLEERRRRLDLEIQTLENTLAQQARQALAAEG
jgi:predicted nuclease with TOPRIM domain